MDNNIFRRFALYCGAVIAGSTVIDLMRFTPWKDNHDILVPILVLAGLAVTYCFGWVARFFLKRIKRGT